MEFENQEIKCSAFWDVEAVVKRAEAKIKKPRSIKERQYYAQDIMLETEILLFCSNYNLGDPECLNCHSVLLKWRQEYRCFAEEELKNINSFR